MSVPQIRLVSQRRGDHFGWTSFHMERPMFFCGSRGEGASRWYYHLSAASEFCEPAFILVSYVLETGPAELSSRHLNTVDQIPTQGVNTESSLSPAGLISQTLVWFSLGAHQFFCWLVLWSAETSVLFFSTCSMSAVGASIESTRSTF